MPEIKANGFYSRKPTLTCIPSDNVHSDGSSSSDDENSNKPSAKKKNICKMIVMKDTEIFEHSLHNNSSDSPFETSEERWPRTVNKDDNTVIPKTDTCESSGSSKASALPPPKKRKVKRCKGVVFRDRHSSLSSSSKPSTARRKFDFSSGSDVPPPKQAVVLPSKRALKLCEAALVDKENELQCSPSNSASRPLVPSSPSDPQAVNNSRDAINLNKSPLPSPIGLRFSNKENVFKAQRKVQGPKSVPSSRLLARKKLISENDGNIVIPKDDGLKSVQQQTSSMKVLQPYYKDLPSKCHSAPALKFNQEGDILDSVKKSVSKILVSVASERKTALQCSQPCSQVIGSPVSQSEADKNTVVSDSGMNLKSVIGLVSSSKESSSNLASNSLQFSRYCSSKSSLPKSDSDPDLFASDVEMNSLATGNNPFSSKENFSTSQVNNSLQCAQPHTGGADPMSAQDSEKEKNMISCDDLRNIPSQKKLKLIKQRSQTRNKKPSCQNGDQSRPQEGLSASETDRSKSMPRQVCTNMLSGKQTRSSNAASLCSQSNARQKGAKSVSLGAGPSAATDAEQNDNSKRSPSLTSKEQHGLIKEIPCVAQEKHNQEQDCQPCSEVTKSLVLKSRSDQVLLASDIDAAFTEAEMPAWRKNCFICSTTGPPEAEGGHKCDTCGTPVHTLPGSCSVKVGDAEGFGAKGQQCLQCVDTTAQPHSGDADPISAQDSEKEKNMISCDDLRNIPSQKKLKLIKQRSQTRNKKPSCQNGDQSRPQEGLSASETDRSKSMPRQVCTNMLSGKQTRSSNAASLRSQSNARQKGAKSVSLGAGPSAATDAEQNDNSKRSPSLTSKKQRGLSKPWRGKKTKKKKGSNAGLWHPGDLPQVIFTEEAYFTKPPSVKSPVEYFNYFFDDGIIETIVFQTNLYSTQLHQKCLNVSKEEIRAFIGILVYLGVCSLPSIEDYWAASTLVRQVSEVMPRTRYQNIHRMIHFHNNEEHGDDKLLKVRPLLDHMRMRCQSLEQETKLSNDERMQGYKGTRAGGLRQYLPDKPSNKWGFKLFVLAGKSGMTYDFIVYSGADTFDLESLTAEEKDLGVGGCAVVALCKAINQPDITTVTFDNWYTGIPLIKYLKTNMNLHSIGTIRRNRMDDCPLTDPKQMMLNGRGAYESYVNTDDIVVVQWVDNKVVCVASSFTGIEPASTMKRYCKEARAKVDVPCPRAILIYNNTMGGVDLSDMLMALYNVPTRARRWYFPLFGYCVELALTNAWLLYKRDSELLGEEKLQFKSSKEFRLAVSQGLTAVNQRSRGRPSLNKSLIKKRIRRPMVPRPHDNLRLDTFNHWPQNSAKGRCKYCKEGFSRITCTKCEAHLCLVPGRNCFIQFHLDKKLPTRSLIQDSDEESKESDPDDPVDK